MWGSRATSRRKYRPKGLQTANVLNVSAAGSLKRRSAMAFRVAVVSLFLLAGLASAGILAWQGMRFIGGYLLYDNDLFRMRSFKITCDGEVITQKHVVEYLDLNTCSNIFAFNMAERRARLLKEVPRIRSAEFARRLPGELYITIHERMPVARLQMNSYFLTIDRDGYILGTSPGVKSLPVIAGHTPAGLRPGVRLEDRKVTKALDFLLVCDTTMVGNYVRARSINVARPEALEVELAEGEKIKFAWQGMQQDSPAGRANMESKLNLLADILRAAAAGGKKHSYIDLTLENNIPAI